MSNALRQSGQRGGDVAEDLVSHVATDWVPLYSLGCTWCDPGNAVTSRVYGWCSLLFSVTFHHSIWPLLGVLL